MVTKKATKETVATTEPKTTVKRTRTCAAKATIAYNAENVGFKAGDVYQALAAAGTPLTVKEIVKAAAISEGETLLGMGWLFKEGKIVATDDKITLA